VKRKKDGPFFLYYSQMLTHDPFQPTPDSADWDAKAMGEKVNQSPKHFADMVAYLDKLIGKLVVRLDELGLREKTLLLFVGDNGTLPQITSQLDGKPYRGGKGKANAAGMHVPLIANWPGTIPARKVCEDLVDSTDFLPTMAAAAGVPIPEKLDGRSFLPQLKGEKGEPREWIYCWYSRDGGADAEHESAFDPRHKLTRAGQLYDLQADPTEKTPLPPDAGPDVRKRLQAALDRFTDARPARLRKGK
jgi:arylsulfatase A